MKTRRRHVRFVALTVVVSLPMLGMAGVASATNAKARANCAKHPHKAKCAKGGGGTTGETGATPPDIIVSVNPDPMQESAESDVVAVVQVEALPIFAGQTVNLSSEQRLNTCGSFLEWTRLNNTIFGAGTSGVVLDNDGNATVFVAGAGCAPGSDLIEADLNAAPYSTATATLTATPPAVTTSPIITGSPNPEVETGDGGPGDVESEVYAVFFVEEDPVYAEQLVDVSSPQLINRCASGLFTAFSNNPGFGFRTG